jgi:HTH-type transcriptional regulator / antitoxin HipB
MLAARISRPEDVGAIILEYRRERRLTQSQLAVELGVSPRWLSHVENGKPTLQLGLVLRVFNELGITLTAAAGTDEPPAKRGGRTDRVTGIDSIVDD